MDNQQSPTDDALGGLIGRMEREIGIVAREDEQSEIEGIQRLAALAEDEMLTNDPQEALARAKKEAAFNQGLVSNQRQAESSLHNEKRHVGRPRTSRKPLTDALIELLPPRELAQIIIDHVKKGKEWAVRLAAMYTQTPETLARIAGEGEGEPVRIESLQAQARLLGIGLDEALADGERALKDAWEEVKPVAGPAPSKVVTQELPSAASEATSTSPSVVPSPDTRV